MGHFYLKKIVEDLDTTDSIRCFFAVLFLARDEKIDIMQEEGEEIRVTLNQIIIYKLINDVKRMILSQFQHGELYG